MNIRLKALRKSLNLTQNELGKSINLSKSSISNIENGIINLTERNIKEICSKHNVNEDWLRDGTGEMFFKIDIDEEFAYLVGSLAAEDCDYKKRIIKALLELEDEKDWYLMLELIQRFKK